MSKFIIVGDPHIGKITNNFGDRGVPMQIGALRLHEELALANGAHHGVILGDLFDVPHPSDEERIAVIRFFASSKLEWLVYLGNHDITDDQHNALRLLAETREAGALRNVTFVEKTRKMNWCDLRVLVLPYGRNKVPDEGRLDLIFHHHSIIGMKTDNGRTIDEHMGVSHKILRGVPAIGGHIHTPQDGKHTTYPGTVAQMTFGEKLPKRIMLGEARRSGLRFRELEYDLPWQLKTIKFDPENPPSCNAKNTRYSITNPQDVPAGWLADHPQVVNVEARKAKRAEAQEAAQVKRVDDVSLLKKFLANHTPMSLDQRRDAVRLHKKIADKVGE